MPFGLSTAPITFQRMINTFFSDSIGKGVCAYLDDLIICSKDGDNHLAKLEAVLLKLREAGLKAKLTKCEFLKSKITFLSHNGDGDGIHIMDDNISVIKNFPQPQNDCGNPVVTLALCPGVMGFFSPQAQGPMSRR